MARLLRDSEPENNDARMGWLVTSTFSYVYMETVEENQNKGEEIHDIGDADSPIQ